MKYTAAMIVLLAVPLVSAPPPRLIREIDLNQTVVAPPDFAPFAILAFSPDEKWLAIAVGANQVEHRKPDPNVDLGPSESLLLVPVNGTAGQQVQVSLGLRPNGNPAWSPDSATVLVEGFANNPVFPPADAIAKLWDLKGDEILRREAPGLAVGRTLDLPFGGIFGFLDSKHLLARRNPVKGMPDAFETLDLQGRVVDTWMVPKHREVADISPARGLLAILTDDASKTLVVDHQSKKVILTKGNPVGFQGYGNASLHGRWQYFTESGKTLCSVGSVGTGYPALDVPTVCWDVDSGRKVAQFHRFPGGAPAAASSRGSRLVLTRDIAFPIRGDGALVFPGTERVVWDFCSGAEVAAWEVPRTTGMNVAISSSGRYVAETAGTLLRIYELP
jgi:hypothetical protein